MAGLGAPICLPPTRIAADPCVPQRDLLLDERGVAQRLSARLGCGGPIAIECCRRLRTKYRLGESLRVLYGVQVQGAGYFVSARTFPDGRSHDAYRRATATAVPRGVLRGALHEPELSAIFWTFPNDRKIANLAVLDSGPGTTAELLGRAWIETRLVAYTPEQSATAECLGGGESVAYAKVYAGDQGARTHQIHAAVQARLASGRSSLRIPRALAYSTAHRTLLLEPLAGRPIADLHGADLQAGLRRWGAALAMLHALPRPADLPRFERVDTAHLQQAARVIARGRPELSRLVADLVCELVRQQPPPPDVPLCLHGDVHPKNGILTDDGLALIDLDQLSVGPAAADLGSLLASLRYRRVVGLLPHAAERRLATAFLEGYASVRDVPEPVGLRWHTAAAIVVERALRAVTWVRPDGLAHLAQILANARSLLDGGGDG